MRRFHKQIVRDENNRPVAVQIPFDEWLCIEELLKAHERVEGGDRSRFAGSLKWGEDAVAYQRRVREEWTR